MVRYQRRNNNTNYYYYTTDPEYTGELITDYTLPSEQSIVGNQLPNGSPPIYCDKSSGYRQVASMNINQSRVLFCQKYFFVKKLYIDSFKWNLSKKCLSSVFRLVILTSITIEWTIQKSDLEREFMVSNKRGDSMNK